MTSAIFHDGYSVARAVPCAWHLRNKLARMADRTSGSQTLAEEWIRKILTVLHLARQQEAKGARLPPALDLFVKDLTGRATTTPAGTSFNARLERSVEHALRYLDGSSEWTEIAPGVSTAEVEDAVRDLLEQITAPAVAESP